MNIVQVTKHRWLIHTGTTHVLYETDSGHHRTLCGKLLKGGEITTAAIRNVENKCKKCLERIRIRNRLVKD